MLANMADPSGSPSTTETLPAPPEPEPPTEAPKEIAGLPIEMFVKEGTSTWASDMQAKEQFAKAEERRDQAARDRQIAQTERSEDSMAGMYTNRMSGNQNVPAGYVELIVCHRNGTQRDGPDGRPMAVVCEVLMGTDPMRPEELVLMAVCPHCVLDLGVTQDDAQLRIAQRHRAWHLDTRKEHQDPIVANLFDDVKKDLVLKTLPRLGMVTDSDRIPCPRCTWVYRIDRNRLWPQ